MCYFNEPILELDDIQASMHLKVCIVLAEKLQILFSCRRRQTFSTRVTFIK